MSLEPAARAGASGSPSRCDSCYRTPQMAAMSLRCDQNAPKLGQKSEVCEVRGGLSPTDVSQRAQTEHSESKIMLLCCLGRGILHLKTFDGHIHRRTGILKMGPEPQTPQTSLDHRGRIPQTGVVRNRGELARDSRLAPSEESPLS